MEPVKTLSVAAIGSSVGSSSRSKLPVWFKAIPNRGMLPATTQKEGAMRPFEGIRVIDVTHVLAGPFAAYQLAVLGADVIKVDDPNEPDQSRESGADHTLNQAMMGTGFLTQGSNKRAIALDLKTEGGRDALKRLVADWA